MSTPRAQKPASGGLEKSPTNKETIMARNKQNIEVVESPSEESSDAPLTIAKPVGEFSLDKFKSKRGAAVANIETLPSALPVHNLAAAKDFAMLHPDEDHYWSSELCFVKVPIKGQKHDTLHLIDEDLAMRFLDSGEILRFRLAVAAKPGDVFFLCEIPTQNVDNTWNTSNLEGCEQAKTRWTKLTSRKAEGVEGYKISFARDPDSFAAPKWPSQTLEELIVRTFAGRIIDREDHPAILRKVGAKQEVS
jgi:hypothetical protein